MGRKSRFGGGVGGGGGLGVGGRRLGGGIGGILGCRLELSN